MTAADNSPQESASSVTRGYTGNRGRPELIRRSNGRLHHHHHFVARAGVDDFEARYNVSQPLLWTSPIKAYFTRTVYLEVSSDVVYPVEPESNDPEPAHEAACGDEGDQGEPEPHKRVDLLVEQVDRQDTLHRVRMVAAHPPQLTTYSKTHVVITIGYY